MAFPSSKSVLKFGPQFVMDAAGEMTVPLTKGDTGTKGADGASGAKGDAGATGAKGDPGTTGTKGDTGPAGTADYTALTNKPPARSQSPITRVLNTIFQPNATRDVLGIYSVQIATTSTITAGQNGDVMLEIASNAAFTLNVQTVGILGNGQVFTLAVALQGVQTIGGQVSGMIPAGYYARLRTVSNAGAPTFAYRAGQEILL